MPPTPQAKVWIPEISEDRLRELAERIRPVIRWGRRKRLSYIKPRGLYKVPEWEEPEFERSADDLALFCQITTWHNMGFQGNSGPSDAEVLAQIPLEYLDKVVAYEIVEILEGYEYDEVGQQYYYRAKTALYIRPKSHMNPRPE